MKRMHEFATGQIKAECEAGIGHLIINNPSRKNAINAAMWRAIPDAIHWLITQGGATVILIIGGGSVDFSAGADISEFDTVRKDAETARIYEASNSRAFAAIRNASVPVIVAIRGVCYGGGFGLAAAADLRLASDDAIFAVPAARLGLAYPADAIQDFIHGLGSQLARKALFTGMSFRAGELAKAGFLLEVTSSDSLQAHAQQLAETIGANAPLSLRAAKLALRAVEQNDEDLLRDAEIIGASTFTSEDYVEGRQAFKERRRPIFHGR